MTSEIEAIDTQRAYWKQIGMFENFKRAKVNMEQFKIQDMYSKPIRKPFAHRRKRIIKSKNTAEQGIKIHNLRNSLPVNGLSQETSHQYSDVLKRYLVRDIKK